MTRTDLLKKLYDNMILKNYSLDTIKSYSGVVNSFFSYLVKNPSLADAPHKQRIEAYLTYRVKHDDISPSTQNVEFNALIYLHRHIIGVNVEGINSLRARQKLRIPPILSPADVTRLLSALPDEYRLIAKLLYGAGLRISEALRLRIKDVDFNLMKLSIHEAKGDKERVIPLPEILTDELKAQIAAAEKLWEVDKANKHAVNLPRGLEKKYPKYPFSRDWYWVFPAPAVVIDLYSKHIQRHHVYDFSVQKAFIQARRKLKLPEYTTPHSLRHAFATHLTQQMISKGFPREMIEAKLTEYMGHSTKETLKWYIHLASPKDAVITLPIESL